MTDRREAGRGRFGEQQALGDHHGVRSSGQTSAQEAASSDREPCSAAPGDGGDLDDGHEQVKSGRRGSSVASSAVQQLKQHHYSLREYGRVSVRS